MSPPAAETPQPDGPASYTPADDELLAFLRWKLAGEALPGAAGAHFHDADIYTADPATLTVRYRSAPARKGEGGGSGSWFFFTRVRPKSSSDSRKSRTVGGGAGTWHSERAPRAVLNGEGSCVGHSQYFSFKRWTGKNCSERTDWYMEFSEAQEGDRERVHGGEPALVLCNIYKKHSSSRSSSSSRSTRKRKPTEEHAGQSSATVKAKRRLFKLFESPAPTPAAACHRNVSSIVSIVTSGLYSRVDAANSVPEASHGMTGGSLDQDQASDGKIGGTLDHYPTFCSELEPLQGMIHNTLDYLNFFPEPETLKNKTTTTPPGLLMSEPDASQSKICGTSDHLRFRAEAEASQGMIDSPSAYLNFLPEPETVQNKATLSSLLMSEPETAQNKATAPSLLMSEPEIAQGKISGTSDYLRFWPEPELLMSKPEIAQGKIGGTSDYLRFWPEPEASQGMIDGRSDYLTISHETEELQNKTSTIPPGLSTFEPEVPAPQGETATSDCGIQVASGDTPPMPVHAPAPAHCYGTRSLLMIDGTVQEFRYGDEMSAPLLPGPAITTSPCHPAAAVDGLLERRPRPTYGAPPDSQAAQTCAACHLLLHCCHWRCHGSAARSSGVSDLQWRSSSVLQLCPVNP